MQLNLTIVFFMTGNSYNLFQKVFFLHKGLKNFTTII